jgi:hypothetical protein
MAAPGSVALSSEQVERARTITNERGSAFSFPVSGGEPIPAHYSFVGAVLDSNQLTISAQRETTGTIITEKKPGHPPIPEPPSAELDALINSVVDLIERQINLKPSA